MIFRVYSCIFLGAILGESAFGGNQKKCVETKCTILCLKQCVETTIWPKANSFAHRTVLLSANTKPFGSQATRLRKQDLEKANHCSLHHPFSHVFAKRLHCQPIVEKNLLRNSSNILTLPKSISIIFNFH